MKVFSLLYTKAMRWAAHKNAPWYLAGLSFCESFFFPIPPDVMLIPMVLARAEKAWFFAALATLSSVIGGVFGFALGWWAFDAIAPWIQSMGYWDQYLHTKAWFDQWGVWVILLAGFTPIPYKVFTITSGAMMMSFFPFILASLIGRGGRFFLVAFVIYMGGPRIEPLVKRYIDWMGWLLVFLLFIVWLVVKL